MYTQHTIETPRDALDACRNGAEIVIDHPAGEIAVTAEKDHDVFYQFYTHSGGETTAVEGIAVRRLVINHEFRID